jgi:hypothetical protein
VDWNQVDEAWFSVVDIWGICPIGDYVFLYEDHGFACSLVGNDTRIVFYHPWSKSTIPLDRFCLGFDLQRFVFV